MINPAIFRAYDIRGNSKKDLSPEIAYKIGFIFTKKVISPINQLLCVAMDGRLSSDNLCQALMQAIEDAGGIVKFIGLEATPVLYFADQVFASAGSIMVTGSHNPKDDNGFKMLKANKPFFGEMIEDLKQQITKFDWPEIIIKPKNREIVDIKLQYFDRVLLNKNINSDLKIAFDPANGATGELIVELSKKLPCKTLIINEKIDGNFPSHEPDPTIAKNLNQLRDSVLKNNCDIGIGFDGDGDRLGVITNKGAFVPGDQLLCIYAKSIIAKNPEATIIADVKASQVFFDYVNDLGGKAIMWKTGHSFIKDKMKELGALFAGEISGHIFFADEYYGYDDAIYAAIRLIEIISNSQLSVDEMIQALPKTFSSSEIKIKIRDEVKFAFVKKIKQDLLKQNINFIEIDGVRVTNKKGWWLLRASNTGPAITLRFEAQTQDGLNSLQTELKDMLLKNIDNDIELDEINKIL